MTKFCNECGEITGFIYGSHFIDGESYCDECYFKKLGEIIEQHPIGIPIDHIN